MRLVVQLQKNQIFTEKFYTIYNRINKYIYIFFSLILINKNFNITIILYYIIEAILISYMSYKYNLYFFLHNIIFDNL